MGLRTFSGGTHGDAKGWRVSTAYYPLPSGPASSAHQMPARRDKGSFSGMTTPPRKAARYPGPPSSANSGMEVGLPHSSSPWRLKVQALH